jgi:hypothetical protein
VDARRAWGSSIINRIAGSVWALQQLHTGKGGWPAKVEHARRWYGPHLERIHDDASMRQADLMQLKQIAAGYPSRERFLTELTLDPPDATGGRAAGLGSATTPRQGALLACTPRPAVTATAWGPPKPPP